MPCLIGLLTGLITALFAYQFGVDGQRASELLDWIFTLPWLENVGIGELKQIENHIDRFLIRHSKLSVTVWKILFWKIRILLL